MRAHSIDGHGYVARERHHIRVRGVLVGDHTLRWGVPSTTSNSLSDLTSVRTLVSLCMVLTMTTRPDPRFV